MNVTLHIEINGKYRRSIEKCEYERRFAIAEKLRGIYPGKIVTVYYVLKSKMNYE